MLSSMSRHFTGLQLSEMSLGWVHTGEEAEDQELDGGQSQLHT